MLTKIYVGAQFPFGLSSLKFHEDVLFRYGDDADLLVHTVDGQAIVVCSRLSDGTKGRLGPTVSAR